MSEKILLTGASGFIGTNLLEDLLEKGYEVPVSKARLAEVKREINLYWRNS